MLNCCLEQPKRAANPCSKVCFGLDLSIYLSIYYAKAASWRYCSSFFAFLFRSSVPLHFALIVCVCCLEVPPYVVSTSSRRLLLSFLFAFCPLFCLSPSTSLCLCGWFFVFSSWVPLFVDYLISFSGGYILIFHVVFVQPGRVPPPPCQLHKTGCCGGYLPRR